MDISQSFKIKFDFNLKFDFDRKAQIDKYYMGHYALINAYKKYDKELIGVLRSLDKYKLLEELLQNTQAVCKEQQEDFTLSKDDYKIHSFRTKTFKCPSVLIEHPYPKAIPECLVSCLVYPAFKYMDAEYAYNVKMYTIELIEENDGIAYAICGWNLETREHINYGTLCTSVNDFFEFIDIQMLKLMNEH